MIRFAIILQQHPIASGVNTNICTRKFPVNRNLAAYIDNRPSVRIRAGGSAGWAYARTGRATIGAIVICCPECCIRVARILPQYPITRGVNARICTRKPAIDGNLAAYIIIFYSSVRICAYSSRWAVAAPAVAAVLAGNRIVYFVFSRAGIFYQGCCCLAVIQRPLRGAAREGGDNRTCCKEGGV